MEPTEQSEAAARRGYELELKGDFFLSREEARWLQRRRAFMDALAVR